MNRLTILTYHSLDDSGSVVSVPPGVFAAQIDAVAEAGFRGITLAAAVEHRAAHGDWPARAAVITFDDGFANTHEVAMPELARHGFTATVFLITGHVGGRNDWSAPPLGLGTRPMMTWAQLGELAEAGLEIAAHTHTHPDLRRLCVEGVIRELDRCRQEIEQRLGRSVVTFAYPYGGVSRAAEEVAARTFRAACTTVLRRAGGEPLHLLPRVDMYYLRQPEALGRLLAGQRDGYLTLRRWGRAMRRGFR